MACEETREKGGSMTTAVGEAPRLIHTLPGRVRVHMPALPELGGHEVETRLRQIRGVHAVRANSLTGNVLVRFDPAATDERSLLTILGGHEPHERGGAGEAPSSPPEPRECHAEKARARIAVRGLDRDPALVRRVVERLESRTGVARVSASPLTGRVLVEYDPGEVVLADLRAELSDLEPPESAGGTQPALLPRSKPLIRDASRAIGAAVGLGVLAARRLAGATAPPVETTAPAVIAGVIGLLDSFPATKNGLRAVLRPDRGDLVLGAIGTVSRTLAGGSLGLVVSGVQPLSSLTEERAREDSWRRYEERTESASPARPGAVIRLEADDATPLPATVVTGVGTTAGCDGLPVPISPGSLVTGGARLYGGPFTVELCGAEPFASVSRPVPMPESFYDRYLRAVVPLSLAHAAVTALVTRSLPRTFAALLLVNPGASLVGAETADSGASARALRSGATVVGTRPERVIRLPEVLLLDRPRLLVNGLEIDAVVPLTDAGDPAEVLARAAGIAAAAGSPWGDAFRAVDGLLAYGGVFAGGAAIAHAGGMPYSLGPVEEEDMVPAEIRLRHRGDHLLVLRGPHPGQTLGVIALRPRLAPGVAELVAVCRGRGVALELLSAGDPIAAEAVAERAGIPLIEGDAVGVIRARQAAGAFVAFASTTAEAAAFATCDMAIGVMDGPGELPTHADLLAPDLATVAAIIDAGARREAAVRDSAILSAIANAVGILWEVQARPRIDRASTPVNIAALAALAAGWVRLRGGERTISAVSRLADPQPERWGRRSAASVLQELGTSEEGLTGAQAAERLRAVAPTTQNHRLLDAVVEQLRSPLTAILAAGAGLSLALGATADVFMIGAMIIANAAAGVWQERQADQAAQTLERLGAVSARVMRDARPVMVPASEVVPGDILLLARGDRVVADARLLSAHGLEVDEAALTGESLPVTKAPDGGTEASRIVLDGSDVAVGTGTAVVVAVGRDTRMGVTAAALALEEPSGQSPLTARLNHLLGQFLPLAAVGGAIVTVAGMLRREPLLAQVAVGASIAVAAVPEGLPLLAKVGEAAVARRLARRHALVRRLSAVEALGRVDVACTDKTGTLTEGSLVLRFVADADGEVSLPSELSASPRRVLLTAALAGPHPDALDAATDHTDVAVARAAYNAGLDEELRARREGESPFDPARSFHASVVQGRLCVEGAAEALAPRCTRVRRCGKTHPLNVDGQQELLARARDLAERGLRVLMVAEGSPEESPENPQGLIALGFLGISDPLRPAVPAAVRKCQNAGVRVIMVTGDHPATARAIAREAGLLVDDEVLTGPEITGLSGDELGVRLARAAVIARATPFDKLRIVESLQSSGHTVAMTGDGVNDAPALRLADVGVAMGRGGTEVARQAADVVLTDDDFSTLVEALVEGRSFWRNIRRALGLLLGGNLGELGLGVGASILGLASPLTTRQILAVNLITDVLPALAVALQRPEHRNLAELAREGASALETPLQREVARRGMATVMPTLASYLLALRSGGLPAARTVAFAGILATQLAQTLDAGRGEGGLSRSVLAAVAGSASLFLATLALPSLRGFLGLALPSPLGWALIGGSALAAVLLGRTFPPPAPAPLTMQLKR